MALANFDRENTKAVESDLSSSFTRDKKPPLVKFKKEKDDGFKTLHSARFQRFPLGEVKDWFKKVPRVRSHQYKSLPLQYSGSHNKVTQRTIQQMHDRTKCLAFKHFHSGNINVGAKPIQKIEKREENGVFSSLDFNWEAPVNLAQVSDALLNYACILNQLWPYDQTALIILRLVNKFNFFSCANSLSERVNLVSSFFNTVLRENATRAGRKGVPMSFAEQEEALKTMLTTSGYSSTVPTGRNPRPEPERFKFNPSNRSSTAPYNNSGQSNNPNHGNISNTGSNSGNSNNSWSNSSSSRTKVVMVGSNPVCFNFNNGFCRNPGSAAGCKDLKNKEFAHLCNKWIDAKQSYCLAKHSRTSFHR